jgi:apocytochrome f
MTITDNKVLLRAVRKQILFAGLFLSLLFHLSFEPAPAAAYPVYAQQAYSNPRAANGKIACANCHLAEKPVGIESPQGVLPDSIFKMIVNIPYDRNLQQVQGNGKPGPLNVGAVVVLPEGFKLAPTTRLSKELREETKGVYIAPYSSTQENILVVGPISGDSHQEIIFPILSPDPQTNKNIHFLNYPIYVGANRGRGQIYPTGEKSNNNMVSAIASGRVTELLENDKGEIRLTLQTAQNQEVKQTLPKGLQLLVNEGDVVKSEQALTKDPNVGGFGQTETEIVLQNPLRVIGFMLFALSILITQILLVLKKKQFEKVQAAEMNF